ncbi:MAG: GH32 C-terminal domain-containing protein [Halanaerobiaceae bacterium]
MKSNIISGNEKVITKKELPSLSVWENIVGNWNMNNKKIINGEHSEDGFLISSLNLKNFIYEADITLKKGAAGALVFRYQDKDKFFAVTIDSKENVVKYWRNPGGIIQDYNTEIKNDKKYNLKLQVIDRNLKVYLDNKKVININDYHTEGRIGLNVFNSTTTFENINIYEIDTDNSNLINLEISKGDISPEFTEDVFQYFVTVENDTNNIKISPELKNKDQILINDKKIKSEKSQIIKLEEGSNNVSLKENLAYNQTLETSIDIYRKPENFYQEKYRPQYHFTPEKNWINDPNGLVYYKGEYHLFYQYHPFSLEWGPMHWGHAVSEDLLHWEHQPIALYPDNLGTIYSGSIVVDKDDTSGFFNGDSGLVAIFTHATGYKGQIQSIAYSKDRGRTWKKYEDNPVINNPGIEDFRDPKVFWHKETEKWIMVVAGGQIRIYSSPDLKNWTLESKNDIWTECPDLFKLPVEGTNKYKWILNAGGRSYYIGEFDGEKFTPETGELPMNFGPDFYAAQSYSGIPESEGRRIMFNWMANWDTIRKAPTYPWKGRMTLPYELGLKQYPEGIRLVQKPVSELKNIRKNKRKWSNKIITSDNNLLSGQKGKSLEIKGEFEFNNSSEFGFKLRKGENEQTIVGYDTENEEMFIDRRRSGNNFAPEIYKTSLKSEDNKIRLHIFLDRSSLELFGNQGKKVISTLIFPEPDNDNMNLYVKDGEVKLNLLKIYELDSVWK